MNPTPAAGILYRSRIESFPRCPVPLLCPPPPLPSPAILASLPRGCRRNFLIHEETGSISREKQKFTRFRTNLVGAPRRANVCSGCDRAHIFLIRIPRAKAQSRWILPSMRKEILYAGGPLVDFRSLPSFLSTHIPPTSVRREREIIRRETEHNLKLSELHNTRVWFVTLFNRTTRRNLN